MTAAGSPARELGLERVDVVEGHEAHVRQPRLERIAEHRLARHRERAVRLPVEAAVCRDQAAPAVDARELDRELGGLRAGVGEEDVLQAVGRDACQLLGRVCQLAVEQDAGGHRMAVELFAHGGDHARVAVAEDEHAVAPAVEVLGAFLVPDPRTLGAHLDVRLHQLGEHRHPLGHVRAVARDGLGSVRGRLELHLVSYLDPLPRRWARTKYSLRLERGPTKGERYGTVGPVDVYIIGFPGNKFTGRIAPAILELVENGTIRVLDLLFVMKDADGAVTTLEAADLDEDGAAFLSIDVAQPGALGDEDAEEVSDDLPANSAALLIAFENLWAAKVVDALQAADAVLIDSIRIPADVVAAAVEAS